MKKSKEEKNSELEQEILKEEIVNEAENETTEGPEVQEDPVEEVSKEEILSEKVKELEAANAELKDQMLRRQAELDNFRKRLIRDKEDAIQFANENLMRDLLTFLDNMERAIAACKQGGDVKSLIE